MTKRLIRTILTSILLTAGDFGCGDEAKRTVNNIKAKDPELVISTGDLSYQKYADC